MARMQTAEKTFLFDLNPTNESDLSVASVHIDIAQCLSIVNRYFARQGMEYVVQNLEIGCQPGGQYAATIMRLPEHWPCVNAWEKGMRLWLQQQNEAAEDAGLESTIARYRDFKIGFDSSHVFSQNLLPDGYFTLDPVNPGDVYEWQQSRVVIPNDGTVGVTTEQDVHMIGAGGRVVGADGSIGLITAYAESRARPHAIDPNTVDTPTGGVFGEMFDVGMDDEDVVSNFQETNNEPPYLLYRDNEFQGYPGGSIQGTYYAQTQDVLGVNAGQNYNTDSTGSFVAPCGLLKVQYKATSVNVPEVPSPGDVPWGLWLKLTLAPGSYKGVLAQTMQEAN